MKEKFEKVSHQVIHQGRMFTFACDEIKNNESKIFTRDYIIHNGAVTVLAFIDQNHILLEHNYRYPFDKTLVELPAGKIEKDEDKLNAARRELEEETGYYANKIIPFGYMVPVAAYSTEIIYFYLAFDLVKTSTNLDEDEVLDTFTLTFDEAIRWIENEKIVDAKTIALLLKAKHFKDNQLFNF